MALPSIDDSVILSVKLRAVDDARRTQDSIRRYCLENGREPPDYSLIELIGKGSFGRVYKATTPKSPAKHFAVKIISIEEGDSHQPGASDTFSDILKEVQTLKLLRETGAKNINHIVEALLVGHSIWMVTEYCAGGSVASLLRPTSGLPEKWSVPILREVAEALRWIHANGVIHRDVKCANVLVTEGGAVQLCDFGVAGLIESKFDKRSTVTGTIPWMAPELFESHVEYGHEVDIWAFGAMAYEIATGLPPNANKIMDISEFSSFLKSNCPRLSGEQHSSNLKDIIAICMVEKAPERPSAADLLDHPFLFDTATQFPVVSLQKLVQEYKLWEAHGGSRVSLFSAGGAEGSADDFCSDVDDEWDFGTLDFSLSPTGSMNHIPVRDGSGPGLSSLQSTAARRRRPPPKMKELVVPLQDVFNPNTISNYDQKSRLFYGKTLDLPLRDTSEPLDVRESLIDLDAAFTPADLPERHLQDTQKWMPPLIAMSDTASVSTILHRPATQEWTFPSMVSSPSTMKTPNSPPSSRTAERPPHRASAVSLIDLDACYMAAPPYATDSAARHSTASLIDLDASIPSKFLPSQATSETMVDSIDRPFSINTSEPTAKSDDDSDRYDKMNIVPPPPGPPDELVMHGLASPDEVKAEMERLIGSLQDHLQCFSEAIKDTF